VSASGAHISSDGRYRYLLWRNWNQEAPTMTFVMLNPSTADAENDDPTIRRCIGFAKREGCGGIGVLNLFSYRTPDPKVLIDAIGAGIDPWGPEHDDYHHFVFEVADGPIVAAWGATPIPGMAAAIRRLQYPTMVCLGTTKTGAPRHPLYVKGDQPLIEWCPS
jgi:hypothetical protein